MCGIAIESTSAFLITISHNNNNIVFCFSCYTIYAGPPPISSLRMASQSITSVTVVWELGTTVTDCPGIMYEVTTLNCGSCPSRVSTVNTNVTCEDLPADTVCDVSVRSVLECGAYSDLVMISGKCYVSPIRYDTAARRMCMCV